MVISSSDEITGKADSNTADWQTMITFLEIVLVNVNPKSWNTQSLQLSNSLLGI